MRGIKEILLRVIVCRGGNHHKVSISIRCTSIECCHEIQRFLCQILLDVVILNGGNPVVDLLHFLGNDIHRSQLMMLRKECGNGHADITSAGNCNLHFQIVF